MRQLKGGLGDRDAGILSQYQFEAPARKHLRTNRDKSRNRSHLFVNLLEDRVDG
ncbi:hypothetical protein C0995_007252, partial [Termitomyces sp. Mi166